MNQLEVGNGEVFEVYGNNVLVELEEASETTEGGIVLPEITRDREQKQMTKGRVAAIGSRVDLEDYPVCRGMGVYFGKYTGIDLDFNRRPYKLLHPDEILAKEI